MRKLTNIMIAVLLLTTTGGAMAEITYPIPPAERTAHVWAIWQGDVETGGIFRRDMQWPDADGNAVPLPAGMTWLRQVPSAEAPVDTTLYSVSYPCPEVADLTAQTLGVTCTATLRPAPELIAAARSVAGQRKVEAMSRFGLSDPADQYRAIALLLAERAGQVLSQSQRDWLAGLAAVTIDYVDLVDLRLAEIEAWIESHPNEVPALGEAAWPPLPEPAGE